MTEVLGSALRGALADRELARDEARALRDAGAVSRAAVLEYAADWLVAVAVRDVLVWMTGQA